jgi:hypothetical protein
MVVCALAVVATSAAAAAIMNSFFIWFLLKPHQRGCGKNCFLRNMFRRTASFRCEVPRPGWGDAFHDPCCRFDH